MTQAETLKRYLDAGMALTQMTRDRAEAIVRELVKAGEVQRNQAHERVEELVERGRKNSEVLVDVVRREITRQVAAMGLVTKQDLAGLEARLDAHLATAKKATAKKATAKKATAKTATGNPAKRASG